MSDPNEKLINYNCRALMIDHRDLEIDLKNFINRMMSFMINELFPEDPNVSLESNFLKFNENDKFNSKINFVDNKIESLSIEIFNKNFVFPQSLPIKNFFLSRNKKNKLKILDFLNSNVLNSTIYTFNPASNSLIHQNDIKSSYMNYTSNFIKNVTGSGLHQQANLDFFFESNTQQLSKEIYKGKCSLIVIDYLDDTNYIDIEEMINDPTYV